MKSKELTHYIEKARKQDPKAIEALYQNTYSKMYSLVKHLCVSSNDVEDILQEGYVNALANLNQLANDEAFFSWLRKTMINAWRMHIRRNMPDYDTTVFDVAEEQMNDWQFGPSLQDTVENFETSREIREMVNALPENQRVCMVLYYFDDMKIEEIAEALGIPPGSVKSRLYYGRLKLKENLEQRGIIQSYGAIAAAPAAEAAASKSVFVRILAALQIPSESGAVAGGMSTTARVAVSMAALLTAGGVISGAVMFPKNRQPGLEVPSAAHTTVTTAVQTTTTTVSTTFSAATTTTTTAAPTTTTTTATTAPKLYVSFDYQKTEGGVILTRYTGNEPDVVIPETIDGMKVVAIGANAFKFKSVLRSVTIPSTVSTVGSAAFRECRNLRSVSLGSGVNEIGNAAFLGCALQSVSIPSNVRSIGVYAFAYCPDLAEVRVAEGTESIGYAAFRDCPNLRSATLPASVNVIGGDSFDRAAEDFTITAPVDTYAYEYELNRHS